MMAKQLAPQIDLTFSELARVNRERAARWMSGSKWSTSDWSNALAGEAGEVCNAVKKLRRIEDDLPNINDPDRQLSTVDQAVIKIGEELADTLIYTVLLANHLGLNLAAEVIRKFNQTSEKYGFPDRLSGSPS